MHEQQKRSRKILSPELQAELEKKQCQAQGAGEPEERVGSDKPGGGRRPKLKFPARKKESQQAAEEKEANPVPPRGERFEDRYTRVTTYLENELHERVQRLRDSGRVVGVTALYNAALRQYLNKYYK